jgi:hypothetical protein
VFHLQVNHMLVRFELLRPPHRQHVETATETDATLLPLVSRALQKIQREGQIAKDSYVSLLLLLAVLELTPSD